MSLSLNDQEGKGCGAEFSDESTSNHTLNILKAAFPYVDKKMQKAVEATVKAAELAESIKFMQSNEEMEACHIHSSSIDVEGMLTSIRQFCTTKEQEFVDMIMNFIKARKMYHTYQSIMGSGGLNGHAFSEFSGSSFNPDMMEMLSSMLSPEQKETFDNFSMIMNTMNMDNAS